MTKRLIVPIVLTVVALGLVHVSWAADVSVPVRMPEPPIESLQLDIDHNVTAFTSEGRSIEDPLADLKDLTDIDLRGFQISMPYDVIIFRDADGALFRCIKKYNTDCVKSLVPEYATLMLDDLGNITKVLDAEGQEVVTENFNLDDVDIESISIEDIRTYRVIEYRDRGTGEAVRRIVQTSFAAMP